MSRHPSVHPVRRSAAAAAAVALIPLLISATVAVHDPGGAALLAVAEPATHLVISEVLAGGASASDEFIELYNPTASDAVLADLELVYVTASGATVTRKGSWTADAAPIPPGGHLLLANDAGVYAAVADVTYGGGLAATGGSVALRVGGASVAIDAVGWGSTVSSWFEGAAAPAPDPGTSLERLPGGEAGGWQDTDDNVVDFVLRAEPDPQGTGSPLTPPSAPTPTPMPTVAATPTPTPTVAATPTPAEAISIQAARDAVDGSSVTVIGSALTDSSFADGGGYLADASGGIAVLVTDGAFVRGDLLQVSGVVGDRYAQRTIRALGADLAVLGDGAGPAAATVATGEIGEGVEGRLVATAGILQGSPTALSGGTAFELDDGSGAIRVVVGSATGIDLGAWQSGAVLQLIGVVGQRDASGSGTAGYRLMPRDQADITAIGTPGSPAPTASPADSGAPSASPDPALSTIAAARASAKNTRLVVRGVVTLPSGLSEAGSAALADASGAIFVRIAEEAGDLVLGELVEIDARRSTWTGMESLHVAVPPRRLGPGTPPAPRSRPTGSIGEADEAVLLQVRGTVTTTPVRSSAGNVYFDLDDGSGPARVFISPRSGIDAGTILQGQLLEVGGVLLQETTGQQPTRGYRLWPRTVGDLRLVAAAPAGGSDAASGGVPGFDAATASPGGTAASIAPRRDEPVPTLARPRATASPPVVVPAGEPAALAEPAAAVQGRPLAPLLLAAAGALLAVASVALARGGLVAGLQRLVSRDAADGSGGVGGERPTDRLEGPPELVPVKVIPAGPGRGGRGADPPS